MNVPNKLTISRVVLVPFFIVAYMIEWYVPAVAIFIVASATDYLDGYLARKYNLVSNFGKIMDPLADKILVYSAFVLLVETQVIPGWTLIIILAREFTVAGMRTVAASEGIVIAAAMSGKIKTVLQMIAVPLLLIVPAIDSIDWNYRFHIMSQGFFYASLFMTVYSGYEYVYKNINVFRQ